MSKILTVIFTSLLLSLSASGYAGSKGTEGEATMLVSKVLNYLQANGKDKTIAEVNNPKGQLHEFGLHVKIHDLNGKLLANGADPKHVGADEMDWKDADGKALYRERAQRLKTVTSGLQDFRLQNPKTKKVERMSSIYEKKGDLVISCDVSL